MEPNRKALLTALPEEIASELKEGQKALAEGNDGKARVCARRAIGKAFRLSKYSAGISSSTSANESLKLICNIEELPSDARDAARRLSTSVMERNTLPFSEKPIEDALAVVRILLGLQNSYYKTI